MGGAPLPSAPLARLTELARTSLGFFRNTRHQERRTCSVCATPVDSFEQCFQCHQHARSGLPISDRVGIVVYGISGHQSGRTMMAYKGRGGLAVRQEDQTRVAVMSMVALGHHVPCAEHLAGRAVTHWATVASLPAKSGRHPLNHLVRNVMPGKEVALVAASDVARPRSLGDDHYHVHQSLPSGCHVLLLDDTWTGGGHAQSAAVALHLAGAAQVSTLVLARWLDPAYETTRTFMPSLSEPDFEPLTCPWTSGEH